MKEDFLSRPPLRPSRNLVILQNCGALILVVHPRRSASVAPTQTTTGKRLVDQRFEEEGAVSKTVALLQTGTNQKRNIGVETSHKRLCGGRLRVSSR